ncbi:MAG TPA: YCF48-related protein [Gemmatimonadaceae bacterium]|nr:YCF48-related protein [Gemmatimonadaceae bacterium]
MIKHLAPARYALSITTLVLITVSVIAFDAGAQRKPVASPTLNRNTRVKGIWEAVNYNQDLDFTDVYFVTPRTGFVAGEHGTILKSVDAGAHWTPLLGGDPAGAAARVQDLRFVDQRHGFAVQSNGGSDPALLRTVDGRTWRASGTVPQHRGDYMFTSPTVGFTSTGNEIRRTRDAGRTWQKVMDCHTTVNVQGLSRNVACGIESFSFPTPSVGYAAGSVGMGVKGVFLAKTTDGGNTWALARVLDDESIHQGFIMFPEPNKGFACTYGGKFFATTDGGATWEGVAGVDCNGKSHGRFADPETGWTLEAHRWNYSTDGGNTWSSRMLDFPAAVEAFSLPRRDRAYVVGDHGMIYRYSVVPTTYTAANSIETPPVGVFSSELDDEVEEFVAEVEAFSAENGGPAGSGGSAGSGDASAGAFAAGGGPGGSGDVGGSATGSADPNAAGMAFDPGDASGAASPAAARAKAKRTGAGNRLGKLQALLDMIGSTMPGFLGRYRNLNLLFEGARTTAGLPTFLQTVKGGLAAFKSSTDKGSAAAALAQLVAAASGLKDQTRVAFMQSSFTPGPEDSGSGFSSSATSVDVTASSAAVAPAGSTVDSAAAGVKSAVADSIANAAKEAAKKGLGGLLKNPFGKKH